MVRYLWGKHLSMPLSLVANFWEMKRTQIYSRKVKWKELLLSILFILCLFAFLRIPTNPAKTKWQIDGPIQTAKNNSKKEYTILVWKHGQRMARRFLRSYGRKERNPFELCSVSNCKLAVDDSQISKADAVLFHLHQTSGVRELPKVRSMNQIWIFFTDESPHHTFFKNPAQTIKDYNNIFNWSMTYRHDSDVPVPYGRTVRIKSSVSNHSTINYALRKTGFVAILGSNCGGLNHRWDYVRELQKNIKVDVYGNCGKKTCPGGFTASCPLLADYKFYLAFENSNCREYMTEKLWWNAFQMESVPIVMGSPKEDYISYCPPQSFIHVDDFSSPAELGQYLKELNNDDEAYNAYFEWKMNYEVLNEHGYFGSPALHMCRICEKLNSHNLELKIYTNLEAFWNKQRDCYAA